MDTDSKIFYISVEDDTFIKIKLNNIRECTEEEHNDDYWQDRFNNWGSDWEDE